MIWLSPTVMELIFEPEKSFSYEPGQFVSVIAPKVENVISLHKRMYSLASPYEIAKKEGYRLSIKFNEGGVGSTYVAGLRRGDLFEIQAPYGDFIFEKRPNSRNAFFISTGTGIAPLRCMLLSKQLKAASLDHVVFLYGCREENEILYPELSENPEVQVVHAVSKPSPTWKGFVGRVTDYIRSLPRDWPWHTTDFFLCGSPQMATDVTVLLTHTMGVSLNAVFQEVFAAPGANATQIKAEIRKIAA